MKIKASNSEKWEEWAQIVLHIFPEIKREDTIREVRAIQNILEDFFGQKIVKIVDVCCGWGRHSIELARYGNDVTGIDISASFINYALNRSKSLRGKVNFLQIDLFKFNVKNYFDVVLNLWTSFGLSEKDEENFLILRKINSFLKKGGIFIIDVANVNKLLFKNFLSSKEDYIQGNKHWWVKDDKVILAETEFNISTSILSLYLALFQEGRTCRENKIDLRIYSFFEMKSLLKNAGFNVEKIFGSFCLDPFLPFSPRLIIVSRKEKEIEVNKKE